MQAPDLTHCFRTEKQLCNPGYRLLRLSRFRTLCRVPGTVFHSPSPQNRCAFVTTPTRFATRNPGLSVDVPSLPKEYQLAQRRRDAEGSQMNQLNRISGDVLDLSIRLHRELGPGLLESVYETVLAGKLIELGYSVDRQKPIDIQFEGRRFEAAFRIDLLVDQKLLVEVKSVERLNPAHRSSC